MKILSITLLTLLSTVAAFGMQERGVLGLETSSLETRPLAQLVDVEYIENLEEAKGLAEYKLSVCLLEPFSMEFLTFKDRMLFTQAISCELSTGINTMSRVAKARSFLRHLKRNLVFNDLMPLLEIANKTSTPSNQEAFRKAMKRRLTSQWLCIQFPEESLQSAFPKNFDWDYFASSLIEFFKVNKFDKVKEEIIWHLLKTNSCPQTLELFFKPFFNALETVEAKKRNVEKALFNSQVLTWFGKNGFLLASPELAAQRDDVKKYNAWMNSIKAAVTRADKTAIWNAIPATEIAQKVFTSFMFAQNCPNGVENPDEAQDFRRAMLWALFVSDASKAMELVLDAVENRDENEEFRRDSLVQFSRLAPTEAIQLCLNAVEKLAEDQDFRSACISVLLKLDFGKAIEICERIVRNPDEDWKFRLACLGLLSSSDRTKALVIYQELGENPEKDLDFSYYCLSLLGSLDLTKAMEVYERIVRKPDQDAHFRCSCLDRLRSLNQAKALVIYQEIATSTCENHHLRFHCLLSLAKLSPTKVNEVYQHIAEHVDEDVEFINTVLLKFSQKDPLEAAEFAEAITGHSINQEA